MTPSGLEVKFSLLRMCWATRSFMCYDYHKSWMCLLISSCHETAYPGHPPPGARSEPEAPEICCVDCPSIGVEPASTKEWKSWNGENVDRPSCCTCLLYIWHYFRLGTLSFAQPREYPYSTPAQVMQLLQEASNGALDNEPWLLEDVYDLCCLLVTSCLK